MTALPDDTAKRYRDIVETARVPIRPGLTKFNSFGKLTNAPAGVPSAFALQIGMD